jgi:hypothetical protein
MDTARAAIAAPTTSIAIAIPATAPPDTPPLSWFCGGELALAELDADIPGLSVAVAVAVAVVCVLERDSTVAPLVVEERPVDDAPAAIEEDKEADNVFTVPLSVPKLEVAVPVIVVEHCTSSPFGPVVGHISEDVDDGFCLFMARFAGVGSLRARTLPKAVVLSIIA